MPDLHPEHCCRASVHGRGPVEHPLLQTIAAHLDRQPGLLIRSVVFTPGSVLFDDSGDGRRYEVLIRDLGVSPPDRPEDRP